jgi:hypothetical protein
VRPFASNRRDVADLFRGQGAREAVIYCPECAEREFSPDAPRSDGG